MDSTVIVVSWRNMVKWNHKKFHPFPPICSTMEKINIIMRKEIMIKKKKTKFLSYIKNKEGTKALNHP